MSLDEFVRNRKELPSFGLHGTAASNVGSILRSKEQTFWGHYFYCGEEERKLSDDMYAQRLKASVDQTLGREAIILLVDINRSIQEGLGNYMDLLGRQLINPTGYYNPFFSCQTFPVYRDPYVITEDGKNVVELRALVLPRSELEPTYESVDKYAVSALELVYENIIDIKNSMK